MKIQQIRYLIAVAEAGSISQAAERLYVAQSSISSAIMDIESEFGTTVFKRSSKGVVLTGEGEELLMDLQRILDQVGFVEYKYTEKNSTHKRFFVSSQHHIGSSDAFLQLLNMLGNTEYRLGFFECKTQEVLENVEKGLSDIGVIFYTEDTKSMMIQELRKKDLIFNHIAYQKPHVYVRKGHPLSAKKTIHVRETENYPFVTYDKIVNNSSIYTENITPYRKAKQVICVTDRAVANAILRSSDAYVVGSGYHGSDENHENIISIPMQDATNIEIGWIVKSKFAISDIIEQYIHILTTD